MKHEKFRTVEKDEYVLTAKRIFAIGAIFACLFGLLICRAFWFELGKNTALENVALRQYRTAVSQSTKRGKILDSQGRALAIDTTVSSINASPKEIDEPVAVSEKLSKILGVDRRKLLEKLSTGRKFAWVKRRVSEKEAAAVEEMNLKGIYSMRESSRSYPNKLLASTVLGAVGLDTEPLGGVELAFNELISARKEGRDVRRDARGRLYLSPTGDTSELKVANVELTIDKTLQYITERELSKAVEKSNASGGSAIVIDVRNGAILALANLPNFDPNQYEKYGPSEWRNRSITDAFEPGSTFKTIIISAALDSNLVAPDDILDCEGGSIQIGNKVVHDAHPHGKLSVADIVKASSNIGAYKIERKLGPRQAYEAIRSFGFGGLTGIDLPGESAGILTHYEKWSDIQFATIAFGQGVAATPIQMVAAFAAIANGGVLYRPYVVKRVVGEDGNELYSGVPEAVGRPISGSTAKIMAGLLHRVTEKGGTGTLAASKEYPVAGKTGTAQKADSKRGGYSHGKYYSSFIGFAPSDAPRIAVYVGIDEPKGGMYYGGLVAAPAFREITDSTLKFLKVPSSLTVAAKEAAEELAVQRPLLNESPPVLSDGEGERVVMQSSDESWALPDFTGFTMKGVLAASGLAQINWRFKGSGVAISQNPPAGSVVTSGGECEVEFKPLM